MTTVSIIAAISRDGSIGRGGDMIYHISDDLRHFKQLTMGKPMVMGRRTFDSLPGGALPGRRNIVVTRNPSWEAPGAERASSLEEAMKMCEGADEVMVIGGGQIYAAALDIADRLLLTIVDDTPADADIRFPDIDPSQWAMTEESEEHVDPRTSLRYRFICLSRK